MFENKKLISSVSGVYGHIQDSISREIYKSRVLYSLTDDYDYIGDMVRHLPIKFSWVDKAEKDLLLYAKKGIKIILADAGVVGRCVRAVYANIPWFCFCDKVVTVDRIDSYPVISRQEAVKQYGDAAFVVSSIKYFNEIEKELKEEGVDNIYNLGRIIQKATYEHSDKQYFECISLHDKEIFVDAGCYDCGSIFAFLNKVNGKFTKIYSFEPEYQFYKNCSQIIQSRKIRNCELIEMGLWKEKDKLHFNSMDDGSRIQNEGDLIIQTISLDEFFEEIEPPTFIKMDIEGAELMALRGGASILRRYHPKLAISVYHKTEDIFKIPEYLLSLYPDYKFDFRHYTGIYGDTVLYAY